MATVELRPGDTLNIIWSSLQETPFGSKQVDANFEFSYEEILGRMRSKGQIAKSRRSGNEGAKFSRMVALAFNALRKGTWSTGANIDRGEVFGSLMARFQDLSLSEYTNITEHARQALNELCLSKDSALTPEQRDQLQPFVDRLKVQKLKHK